MTHMPKKIKYPIIIFDGIDKTGKTTLVNAFNKATGYKYPVIDRLLGSVVSYGKLRKRKIDAANIEMIEKELSKIAVYVWIDCSKETMSARFKATNETDITLAEAKELRRYFQEYFDTTAVPVIKVNTDKMSVTRTVNYIIKSLEKIKLWDC